MLMSDKFIATRKCRENEVPDWAKNQPMLAGALEILLPLGVIHE